MVKRRSYANKKYGIGAALGRSDVHPGYSHTKTAQQNVDIGVRYWEKHIKELKGRPIYLVVAHELDAIAKMPPNYVSFKKGAQMAFELHDKQEKKGSHQIL